jgi:hypothetical protein
MEWNAYFDETSDEFIRFPGTWAVVDQAPGTLASISGDNADLQVKVLDHAVDSEDAATDYVASLRSGIDVLSVTPVEQFGTPGFNVAYTVTTLDGASESGLVTILNGGEVAHAANLILTDVSDIDLNNVDITAEDTPQALKDAVTLMQSFSLMPELQLSAAETE